MEPSFWFFPKNIKQHISLFKQEYFWNKLGFLFFNFLLLPQLLIKTLTEIISCLRNPDLSSLDRSSYQQAFKSWRLQRYKAPTSFGGMEDSVQIIRTSSSSQRQKHSCRTDWHRLLVACWPPCAHVAPLFLAFLGICHSGYVLHRTVMVPNQVDKEEHMFTLKPSRVWDTVHIPTEVDTAIFSLHLIVIGLLCFESQAKCFHSVARNSEMFFFPSILEVLAMCLQLEGGRHKQKKQ